MAKVASKITGEGFVRFEFADGEILQCDVADVPRETLERLALHGASQKVGDSYAGAESVTEARLTAEAVWRNLCAGIWAVKSTRGGKIVEALHRATGQPFETCLERFTAMDDGSKKALRKHPDVVKALAEMEVERAAKLAEAAGANGNDLNDLF